MTEQGDLQWIDETHWTWTPFAGIAEGDHSYTAQVIDGNGGEGKASDNGVANADGSTTTGYDIYLDTTPPEQEAFIDTVNDDVGQVQGDIGDGGITDDTRPIFNGHIDKILDSKSGEELHIFEIDANGQMIDVTELGDLKWDDETHWQWTPFDDLGEGAHHYVAQVMDANGLVGKASTDENLANPDDTLGYDIYLDTTPPDQEVFIDEIIDNAGTVQGDIGDEGLTDDAIPVIHGHLDKALDSKAKEELHIFDKDTKGNTIDVTEDGTFTWDADGKNWTWTPDAALAEGQHSYTAQVMDGNELVGKASENGVADADGTTGYDIYLDTTPPDQKVFIDEIIDDEGLNIKFRYIEIQGDATKRFFPGNHYLTAN